MFPKFLTLFAVCALSAPGLSAFQWTTTYENPSAFRPSVLAPASAGFLMGVGPALAESVDGVSWSVVKSFPVGVVETMEWNGALLAAVSNGVLWVRPSAAEEWFSVNLRHQILQLVDAGDRVMVVFAGGTSQSSDLRQWSAFAPLPIGATLIRDPETYGWSDLRGNFAYMANGDGQFVLTSAHGGQTFWISADGVQWVTRDLPRLAPSNFGPRVAFFEGQWVFTAFDASLQPFFLASQDLVKFQEVFTPSRLTRISSLRAGPEGFVAGASVLQEGSFLLRSTDGLTWTFQPVPYTLSASTLLAESSAGTLLFENTLSTERVFGLRLFIARDGTLSRLDRPKVGDNASMTPLLVAGNRFFHSNLFSGILTSINGADWLPVEAPGFPHDPRNTLDSVVFLGDRWFLLAADGTVLTSIDGASWAVIVPTISTALSDPRLQRAVEFKDQLFAIARSPESAGGELVRSTDGIAWTPAGVAQLAKSARLVVTDDGLLANVAGFGQGPADYLSTDGQTWTTLETGIGSRARDWVQSFGGKLLGTKSPSDSTTALWSLAGQADPPLRSERGSIEPRVIATIPEASLLVVTAIGEVYAGPQGGRLQVVKELPEATHVAVANGVAVVASLGKLSTAPVVPAATIWDVGVRRIRGWLESDWYGWIYAEGFPWLFHPDQGWQYQQPETGASLVVWDQNLRQWLWTSPEVYPFVFSFQRNAWLYYQLTTVTPARWYYDSVLAGWIPERDLSIPVPPPPPGRE